MKALQAILTYLWRHPLVWLVPVLTYGVLFSWLASKAGNAPQTPFIYDF